MEKSPAMNNCDAIDGQREKKKGGDKRFVCMEEGCGYRRKRKCHLKRHRADVHNDGVVWHE